MRKFFGRQNRGSKLGAASRKKQRARRRSGGFRTALGVEWLEDRRLLAAGDLDLTFGGGDGLVVDDLGLSKDEEVYATAVQSDGKVLVAGLVNVPGGGSRDFMVTRYDVDGTRDTSFGTGGFIVVDIGGGSEQVSDLAIDSVGRILAVGSASNGTNSGFAVFRLTTSGQLDTTFSGDGKLLSIAQTSLGQNVSITTDMHGIALQADGKIVVGGSTNTVGATERDYVLGRFNDDGTLDTSFNSNGFVITDFGGTLANSREDRLQDIAIQNDGRIVAVGQSETNIGGHQSFSLARYNTNGSLDTTFGGGDGLVWTDILPSGTSQATATAVKLEPDGQIVVGGRTTAGNGDFVVARYNTDGSLDTGFASASAVPGTLRINFALSDMADDLILQPQPDGKYVLAGITGNTALTNNFAVARVLLNGQLDTSFSGDGKAEVHFAGTSAIRVGGLVMQPTGKIVVGGWTVPTVGNRDIALARFESGLVVNNIGGFSAVDEGATYTLYLTATDPTTTQWTINWGDGNVENFAGNPSSVTHVYADGDANYTISATVTNSSGTVGAGTQPIAVSNVDPTLTVDLGSLVLNEGQTAENSGTYGDVPADTVTVAASIGTVTQGGGFWNWSYDTVDDFDGPVTITATDEDGGVTVVAFDLEVKNVDPVLTVDQASVVAAVSQTVINSGTVTDVPADGITLIASIGIVVNNNDGTWSWSYTTGVDPPDQTVTIAAFDDNGGFGRITFSLSVEPTLTVVPDQTANEGSPINITDIGTFTDIVQAGNDGWPVEIGLDANDFTAIGAFDPTANVVFNTDTLAISGGFTGSGTTVTANTGFGNYQIAVFTFSDFELDAGVTITAVGSRPIAILSQGNMSIAGVIDVSARSNGSPGPAYEQLAGAGGGNGGLMGSSLDQGDAAAGGPANSGGMWASGSGSGGGSGGGFGGRGGRAETNPSGGLAPLSSAGVAFANLAAGVQGGSGGGTASSAFSGTFSGGGGGGGGIELGAVGVLSVASGGQILANGGDGQTLFVVSTDGTGGGGAGGGILLHATSVNQHGTLEAKGGNGGGAPRNGGGGGGGAILIVHHESGSFDNTGGLQSVNGGTAGLGGGGESGLVGVLAIQADTPAATPVIESFDYVIEWGDGSSTDSGAATIDTPGVNSGDIVQGSFNGSHTYADNGIYTVTVTINDSSGGSDTQTFTMTVNNIAPTLVISGAADVDEADGYTLNLSSADPGPDTIASWTINWGDGNVETVSGNPSSFAHTYADGDNNYTISATATDEDGTFAAGNTVVVAVHNVDPTLAISGAADVSEGSAYTLDLSSFDPGVDTISEWTINWGDGNIETVAGDPSSALHTYADGDNSYTVSATATDEDGTYAAAGTVAVLVLNVAPALAISGAASSDEGSSYTLNLSSSDPGDDTIASWTINWGDGNIETVVGNPSSAAHTYADGDDSYTISATATDEDGTYAAAGTVAVLVLNVAPALVISGNSNSDEGSSYTLNLSSSDPGTDSITSWTINWGDGNIETVSGNPSSAVHTYADGDNSYTISATATDEDDTFAAGNTVAVTVENVDPTLAISGAASANEGSSYTLNLSSSDPGTDAIASWTINWGDGNVQTVSGNPSGVAHTYADGSNSYTISATATDDDGTFNSNSLGVTVNNVAPTLTLSGAASVNQDTPYTLNLSSADPGVDTIASWTINWGDGNIQTVTGNPASVVHVFDNSGNYTISATATDEDGTFASNSLAVTVGGAGVTLIGGVLHIVGTEDCDIVIITRFNNNIKVLASFLDNNPVTFSDSSVTEIQVQMHGGTDIVLTTPNVTKLMTIDGGSGNDLLTGGGGRNVILGGLGHDILHGSAGDDVLLGGAGNDDIFGGSGNDVLVGGDGNDILDGGTGRDIIIGSQDEDTLKGGNDDDILIGGFTSHDNNVAALDAIMAIWGSSASFNSRVATLTGSGGMLQAGVSVFDDDDDDNIMGNAGRDLVFGDTNPWDGAVDTISLHPLQDVLVAVN